MPNTLTQLSSSKAFKFYAKKKKATKNQKLVGFKKFPTKFFQNFLKMIQNCQVWSASPLWTLPGYQDSVLQVLTITTKNWIFFILLLFMSFICTHFFFSHDFYFVWFGFIFFWLFVMWVFLVGWLDFFKSLEHALLWQV